MCIARQFARVKMCSKGHATTGGSGGIRASEIHGKYCCATVRLRIFKLFLDFTVKCFVKLDYFCEAIGIFESPKCDVNPQPNTRGIGPLVGRTSGNRRSVMHVLAVIFSITYHFFFICQYIFIQVILSGREIYPLLMYPSTFLVF